MAVKDEVVPDPAGADLLGEVAVVSGSKHCAHRVGQPTRAGRWFGVLCVGLASLFSLLLSKNIRQSIGLWQRRGCAFFRGRHCDTCTVSKA